MTKLAQRNKITLNKNEVAVMANISPLGLSTIDGLAMVTEIPREVIKDSIITLKEKGFIMPGNYWFSEYTPSTIVAVGEGQSAREMFASAQRLINICAENPLINADYNISETMHKFREIIIARAKSSGPNNMILIAEVSSDKSVAEINEILKKDKLVKRN